MWNPSHHKPVVLLEAPSLPFPTTRLREALNMGKASDEWLSPSVAEVGLEMAFNPRWANQYHKSQVWDQQDGSVVRCLLPSLTA